jgi:hypothetical protein
MTVKYNIPTAVLQRIKVFWVITLCRVVVELLEFCSLLGNIWIFSTVCVDCGEETSHVPHTILAVSFTMFLTDAITHLGRILDSLFDL